MKRIAALCLLAFGLVSGCHAASPSFSSFNQTYFTTNNLFISIRTNWISTNSITTLIVTNLYVTNLYSTNIIVNGTNVATFGDLLWTNISNVLQPLAGTSVRTTNHTVRAALIVDGALVLGSIGYSGSGDINVATTNDGTVLVSPSTSTPTDTTVHLAHGRGTGQIMTIVNASSSGGAFRMLNGDPTTDVPSTYLRLNGDWVSTNKGDALLMIHAGPFWSEAARMAGSTNIASPTVINPTDNYLPVRISASSFGDSPLARPGSSSNLLATGTLLLGGTNSFDYFGSFSEGLTIGSFNDTTRGGAGTWEIILGGGDPNGDQAYADIAGNGISSLVSANLFVGSDSYSTFLSAQTNREPMGVYSGWNSTNLLALAPFMSDGASKYAYKFDTGIPLGTTALATFQNNTTNMITIGPTGQVIFGPGTTNVLSRNANDLVYTNGGSSVNFEVRKGDGASAKLGLSTGSHVLLLGGASSDVYVGVNNNGSGDFVFQATAFTSTSAGTDDLGSTVVPWDDVYTDKVILTGITKAQKTALTPSDGMIVYQTDNTPGLRVYVAGTWYIVSTGADP